MPGRVGVPAGCPVLKCSGIFQGGLDEQVPILPFTFMDDFAVDLDDPGW